MNLEEYLKLNLKDSELCFPQKLNIILIETDQYAGNLVQDVCENVFGYEYSEHIRSYQCSEEYIENMEKRGYDPDYFMNLSQDCQHEEYGEVIAGIFRTPVTKEEFSGDDLGHTFDNCPYTVALFFRETLSDKDIATIKDIAIETLKGKANVLDMGQLGIHMERVVKVEPNIN